MSRPSREHDEAAAERMRDLAGFLRSLLRPVLIIAAVVAAVLAVIFVL